MSKGDQGPLVGAEVSAEAEVDARDDAVQYISPQVLGAHGDDKRLFPGKKT